MANTDEDGVYPVAWYKETKDHPNGVIQIARDFRLFVEVKKSWRDQYPDHLSAQVEQTVEEVYGEAMVARIAHSEQLWMTHFGANPKSKSCARRRLWPRLSLASSAKTVLSGHGCGAWASGDELRPE